MLEDDALHAQPLAERLELVPVLHRQERGPAPHVAPPDPSDAARLRARARRDPLGRQRGRGEGRCRERVR